MLARTVVSRVAKYMFPSGIWYIDPKTEKITHKPQLLWNVPWVSTNNMARNPDKHCGLLKTVLFECFGFHPEFCKTVCHKLVVHPTTFHDLWKMYSIQEKLQYEAKCGIELRPNVDWAYGGYFYCYSMKEAHDKRIVVQKEIDKHFREPYKVQIKRGCTEMEDRFGPSSEWEDTAEAILLAEDHYASFFDFPSELMNQPAFIKPDIFLKWFDRAADIGDKTVQEYNGHRPLVEMDLDYY